MVTKSKFFPGFKETLPMVNDKVFVITGTTSGTGYIAAKTVAEKGGHVVLLNRTSERVTTMLHNLQQDVPQGTFVTVECDLQSFDSVRQAAQEIRAKYDKIYCLCHNAGIMATADEATIDGYDKQMQTNHLGHFLLTAQLLELLQAQALETGDARIVTQTSAGRLEMHELEAQYLEANGGNLGGDAVGFSSGPRFVRYFQSKLANIVFTWALHTKLQASSSNNSNTKIRSIACHPGLADTQLRSTVDQGFVGNLLTRILTPLLVQSGEDGTMGMLKAMMDPTAESGVLYGPTQLGEIYGQAEAIPLRPFETDPKHVELLWSLSEKATGVKLL